MRPRGSPTRPISGAFTLDLDKIESGSMSGSIGGPQLVNHNLDDIFNDQPVVLPPTLAGRPRPNNYPMSPPGVNPAAASLPSSQQPIVPLAENQEATEALDVILTQVLSKDASQCISALSQLDELVKDSEKVVLLASRMDQLLTACYMQYRHILTQKMRTDNAASNAKEVMKLFQYVTMILMSTYHHVELTRRATSAALHDIFDIVISILLEPKIEQLSDGAQLIRALNVLTVKIIDRSDHTHVTSAIVRLLSDSVGKANNNPKFVEIAMKCIWKIIRLLPIWMDEIQHPVDADVVLADLHDFLKTYPSSYWKKQDSDTPLRTVKTILHTMVKVRGDAILDHLTKIDDPQNSEMVSYLRKLLNNGIGKENTADTNDIMKNGNTVAGSKPASSRGPRLGKSEHETLAEIFKKIGQKEQTKQGLQELYNFKLENPAADLEPFLVKSSEYFRNYIERGLKDIENNMATTNTNGSSNLGSGRVLTESRTNNGSAADQSSAATLYMDKLKMLRTQGGLDRGAGEMSGASSATSGIGTSSLASAYRIAATSSVSSARSESTNSNEVMMAEDETPAASTGSVDPNVENIRRRLERIRQGF